MQSKGTRLVDRGGIWYVVWRGNSRGVSTGERSRDAAEGHLAAFIAEGHSNKGGAKSGLTVRQALDDYEREHVLKKVIDTTRAADIKAHLESFFADMPAADLGPDEFAGYVSWRRAGNGGGKKPRKAKDPTIRRELGMLTAAFGNAVRQKRLTRDKMPFIDLPHGSVPRDHWLFEDECDMLLRACLPDEGGTWQEAMAAAATLPRVFGFVAIVLGTGARPGKTVTRLTRFQVDMRAQQINFAPAGHRQTKKRRPIVPIADWLLPVLESLLRENEGSYVLGSSGSVRKPFQTAVARAGKALQRLGRHERAEAMRRTIPYSLRHTWATLAAQKGVPLWEIAGVLGDSIATVTKNYAHHCPEHLRGAVNFRTTVVDRG